MSLLTFTEFVTDCKLVDTETFFLAKFETIFVAANSLDKQREDDPSVSGVGARCAPVTLPRPRPSLSVGRTRTRS
jgi:hypothetical protein